MLKRGVVLAGLLCAQAHAVTVAWIDTEQVMQHERGVLDKKLQDTFKDRIQEVQSLQKDLAAHQDKLKRDGAVLSEDMRSELERSVRDKLRHFEAKRDSLNEAIGARNQEELSKFVKQVNGMVAEISAGTYDVVFQKNAALYLNPEYDITSKVLDKLGFPHS